MEGKGTDRRPFDRFRVLQTIKGRHMRSHSTSREAINLYSSRPFDRLRDRRVARLRGRFNSHISKPR